MTNRPILGALAGSAAALSVALVLQACSGCTTTATSGNVAIAPTAAAASPGQFIGTFDLCPENKNKHTVEATSDGRQVWCLRQSWGYRRPNGETIIAPAGLSTDLASIPRFAWIALPPDGVWARGAIIHDYLFKTSGRCVLWHEPSGCSRLTPYTRQEANQILDEMMSTLNVPYATRPLCAKGDDPLALCAKGDDPLGSRHWFCVRLGTLDPATRPHPVAVSWPLILRGGRPFRV